MIPLATSKILRITSIYSPADKRFVGCGSQAGSQLLLLRLVEKPEPGGSIIGNTHAAWRIDEPCEVDDGFLMVRAVIESTMMR